MTVGRCLHDRCGLTSHAATLANVRSTACKHAQNRVGRYHRPCLRRTSAACTAIGNSRRICPQRFTVPAVGSDTVSSSDTDDDQEFAKNIWQPVPPTPALGRKRKVALLLGCAILEVSVTGGLMWAPLLGAIAFAMLQPTRAEIAEQQEAAVQQAVTATRIRLSRELPVTPVESVAWMNRLMQEMWASFWQPFLLANNLNMWQDTVAAAAPRGWEVEIADVSIGTLAPEMSSFQAFADPNNGTVTAVDCQMVFDSSDVRFVVVGRGPLGAFTARVSAVRMEGQVRISPLLQHRMLLIGFKEQPDVRVSLSISAPLFKTSLSPGDLGQLSFIQGLMGAAIRDMLVEPRRMAISLDADIRVEEAVATTLHITVDSITGLTAAALGASTASNSTAAATADRDSSRGSPAAGRKSAAGQSPSKLLLVAVDTLTQVSRSTDPVPCSPSSRSASVRQDVSLDLPRKQGLFRLEVRDVSRGGKGSLMGSCLLWVAAARDGTTLFWSHDRSGGPVATRWAPSEPPWRVDLPLEATAAAAGAGAGRHTSSSSSSAAAAAALSVSLGVSVEPWVYKQRVPGVVGGERTAGPRVVVVQVVEARGLSLPSSGTSDTTSCVNSHIQICYDQECYCTSTYYGSSSPVFNELFAFQENPGMMTRRVKLEVWNEGAGTAAATTGSSSSSKGTSGRLFSKHRASGFGSGSKGFKSLGWSRSSSSKGLKGGKNAAAAKISSHQLSEIPEESDDSSNKEDDVNSHMLFDVELEDDESLEAEGMAQMQSASHNGSSSGSSSNGLSLGSVTVNLDQLSETVIQDRWYYLSGNEAAEVRLRMTVVPGALPEQQQSKHSSHSSSSSSSSMLVGGHSAAAAASSIGNGSADVCELLSFFHRSLQTSSRDSVLVEVVSARLYLPLSSMDSTDIDQPAYIIKYDGTATITLPHYMQPADKQQQQKSRSPKLIGSSSSSRNPKSPSPSRPSSSSSSKRQSAASPTSSDLFDRVSAGNVSAQVAARYCLARAVFPLTAAAAELQQPSLPSAASSSSGHRPAGEDTAESAAVNDNGGPPSDHDAAAAAARPKLVVSLLDPDDLPDSMAAVAAAGSGSSSSSDHTFEDVGCAEVDVVSLLHGSSISLNTDEPAGGVSAAAAPAASWEGWVKLNKDGGHLLLRLTQLPASDPADLAPPPSAATLANDAASSSNGDSKPGDTSQAAAAAAVVAGGRDSSSVNDEKHSSGGGGLLHINAGDLGHVIKKGYSEAEAQVSGAVGRLSDVAGSLWHGSSSQVGSWVSGIHLPSWPRTGSSSSSSKGEDADKSDTADKAQKQKKEVAKDEPGTAAAAAAAVKQIEDSPKQQQGAADTSSVDLSTMARSWGWFPLKLEQQQQQQQSGRSSTGEAQHHSNNKEQQHSQPSVVDKLQEQQYQQAAAHSDHSQRSSHSGVSGIFAAISNVFTPHKHEGDHHSTGESGAQQNATKLQRTQQQQQQQQQRPVQRQTILLSPSETDSGIMHSSRDNSTSSRDESSRDARDDVAATAAAAEGSQTSAISPAGATSAASKQVAADQSQQTSSTEPMDPSDRRPPASTDAAQGHVEKSSSKLTEAGAESKSVAQHQQAARKPVPKPNAGAAAVGAAETAAATIGSWPLSAIVPPKGRADAADVWSYDGDGDAEQAVVRNKSWEGAEDEEEF